MVRGEMKQPKNKTKDWKERFKNKFFMVDKDVAAFIEKEIARARLEGMIEELELQNHVLAVGGSLEEYTELDIITGNKRRIKELKQQLSKPNAEEE